MITYPKYRIEDTYTNLDSMGNFVGVSDQPIIFKATADNGTLFLRGLNVPKKGWIAQYFYRYKNGATTQELQLYASDLKASIVDAQIDAIERLLKDIKLQKKPGLKERIAELEGWIAELFQKKPPKPKPKRKPKPKEKEESKPE